MRYFDTTCWTLVITDKFAMKIFILTYCRNPDLFYGTQLIFRTLRVGFPNARVHIIDNDSLPAAQERIKSLCRVNECAFETLKRPGTEHHSFIESTLRTEATGPTPREPIVFLDPDICLWRSWEDVSFQGLMAGKGVGQFLDPVTKTVTMPRIHSSFLWITDPERLWKEILQFKAGRFDFQPFLPCSFKIDGTWYRFDTGASLYAALPGRCSLFTETHFEGYDHIYAGSHIDWILPHYNDECREMMERTHHHAKNNNLAALKGVWREQDRNFSRFLNKESGTQEKELCDSFEITSRITDR